MDRNTLTLSQISIRLARVVSLREEGINDEAIAQLLTAVKSAAGQSIIGPFLVNDLVRTALQELRRALRQNEEELIVLNFIEGTLERADILRPCARDDFLSLREYEVLEQLSVGQSNKEIAKILELTENTVKFHLKNIYSKLSVSRRTQAINEARRLKIIH